MTNVTMGIMIVYDALRNNLQPLRIKCCVGAGVSVVASRRNGLLALNICLPRCNTGTFPSPIILAIKKCPYTRNYFMVV